VRLLRAERAASHTLRPSYADVCASAAPTSGSRVERLETVVLVHGFPDDQTVWEPVVTALPDDWHVITYDVRGAGRSTQPEGAPPTAQNCSSKP